MPELIRDDSDDNFQTMVGQEFTCRTSRRTHKITAADKAEFKPSLWVGTQDDGFAAPGIKCPDCGAKVYLSRTGKIRHDS